MDQLNATLGRGTIRILSVGAKDAAWKLRSEHLTPRWTTRWDELPRIKSGSVGLGGKADPQLPLMRLVCINPVSMSDSAVSRSFGRREVAASRRSVTRSAFVGSYWDRLPTKLLGETQRDFLPVLPADVV